MSFTFTRHTVKHRAAILTKKQLLHVTLVAGTTRDPERNQLILSMSHALGHASKPLLGMLFKFR